MSILDGIQHLEAMEFGDKRVFIRVDFNVPLDNGQITDDFRIRMAIPTIQYVIRNGGLPILASHLGRPKGKVKPELSLRPVAERLAELLPEREIVFADDCVSDGIRYQSERLDPGQVLLLENLRFHRGEKAGDENFARLLAELADVYVNDAFGTCHRAHASMATMVPHFGDNKGAGYLVFKEIEMLGEAMNTPKTPFVAVLGGAKVSDKIGVIERLLKKCSNLCIGGAMANTFLKAQGHTTGNGLVEEDALETAQNLLTQAELSETCELLLPTDLVVADSIDASEGTALNGVDVAEGQAAFDVGPQTAARFREVILGAGTIFWNGPMGVFEKTPFEAGTRAVAQALVDSEGHSIVGGGDSAAAIREFGFADAISHVSTGGGASLEMAEGKALPGIEALRLTSPQEQE